MKREKVCHRCDWMTDEQLVGFIGSLTALLSEALEEQRERKEKEAKGDAEMYLRRDS